ncbi:MAG: GTPase ObgE [Erysipelotrichaceae bacterium]|nr:GTPase ObgE [Erysipelotrichaceae bacterium]
MLIDRAVIEVRSGNGGNGAISFYREKNVPKGGPDGGNGGKGGSVYLVARSNVNTLLAYRHGKLLAAEDGEKGDKKMRFGLSGKDVYAEVPVGTVVYKEEGNVFLADLSHDGDVFRLAKGGRGGRGNAAFKSSRLRVPKVAENGYPGERFRAILELKLLADAALIGFPSVGKSTLLNIVSKASAETGDYPFTTLIPNLGVVTLPSIGQFVLADMPGLIEGASKGKGLGISFLRHIERCRVLIHMVSMESEDPYRDYSCIREELKEYGARLEERPEIVVCSKMDVDGAEEKKKAFDKKLGFESIGISALTEENILPLMKKAFTLIQNTEPFPLFIKGQEEGGIKVYDAHKDQEKVDFAILHPSAHVFVITGKEVTEKYGRINLSTDQGVAQLLRYLSSLGIDEVLKEKGAENGDTVRLVDFEFEYLE